MLDGQLDRHPRPESLESRVRRNSQARFGGGPTEKARVSGTSPAAYPTREGLEKDRKAPRPRPTSAELRDNLAAPLYASLLQRIILVGPGLALSIVAGLVLARRMA
jgi:hypothetical protein